jgi:hypothetical protein
MPAWLTPDPHVPKGRFSAKFFAFWVDSGTSKVALNINVIVNLTTKLRILRGGRRPHSKIIAPQQWLETR